MAITWDDIAHFAPQFAATPGPSRTLVLYLVAAEVHEDTWGEQYKRGALTMACHLLTLMKQRGNGPKTELSEAQMSAAFASMLQLGELGLTSYGVEYQRLTRQLSETMFGLLI